ASRSGTATLTSPSTEPARVRVAYVTGEFLPALGIAPTLGRGIGAGDARPGAAPVALLGHALWRTRYGGDPGVVGRTVSLDGTPTTIVGVMPPHVPVADAEIWQPLVPG